MCYVLCVCVHVCVWQRRCTFDSSLSLSLYFTLSISLSRSLSLTHTLSLSVTHNTHTHTLYSVRACVCARGSKIHAQHCAGEKARKTGGWRGSKTRGKGGGGGIYRGETILPIDNAYSRAKKKKGWVREQDALKRSLIGRLVLKRPMISNLFFVFVFFVSGHW